MRKKNIKKAMSFFELLCFVAAWAVGLSMAWSASNTVRQLESTAQIATTHPASTSAPSTR